jgi:bifunctional non-homologous end joining protein LigD
MLLRRVQELPGGTGWCYEVKLDGYRMQALKDGGNVHLLSRGGADYSRSAHRETARCLTTEAAEDTLYHKVNRQTL